MTSLFANHVEKTLRILNKSYSMLKLTLMDSPMIALYAISLSGLQMHFMLTRVDLIKTSLENKYFLNFQALICLGVF